MLPDVVVHGASRNDSVVRSTRKNRVSDCSANPFLKGFDGVATQANLFQRGFDGVATQANLFQRDSTEWQRRQISFKKDSTEWQRRQISFKKDSREWQWKEISFKKRLKRKARPKGKRPKAIKGFHSMLNKTKNPIKIDRVLWYLQESNQGHMDFQSIALPTELRYRA